MDHPAGVSEREVLEFVERFESAQRTKSFAAVNGFIHPDALFRFNDGDHRGVDQVRRAFEATWAHEVESERYEMTGIEVQCLDADSAAVTFTWAWSGDGPQGPFRIVGRGTSVLTRDAGELKIRVEHLSR